MWAKHKKQPGFTIVELLIVIVVIAILAAISIVAYNGIQNRARASAASSALSQANKKILVAMNDGTLSNYPANQAAFDALGISTNGVVYQYKPVPITNPTGYCITATAGNVSYRSTQTGQLVSGACAGHSNAGIAAITNLASNPAATGYTSTQSQFGWRNDRYGGNGTYSTVANVTDGPNGQLNTYVRFTFTQVVAGSRGFHNVGNPEGAGSFGNGAPINENVAYSFSAYLRSSDGQGNAVIAARFANETDWIGAAINGSSASLSGSQWARSVLNITAPAGATRVQLYIKQVSSVNHAIGDTLDGTGLMVTEGTSASNYADGNSNGWDWNGVANSSTSSGTPL